MSQSYTGEAFGKLTPIIICSLSLLTIIPWQVSKNYSFYIYFYFIVVFNQYEFLYQYYVVAFTEVRETSLLNLPGLF